MRVSYKIIKDFIAEQVEDELVLTNQLTDELCILNSSATFLYTLIKSGYSDKDILVEKWLNNNWIDAPEKEILVKMLDDSLEQMVESQIIKREETEE